MPKRKVKARAKPHEKTFRNKTEAEYAGMLEDDPTILKWRYEAITFKVGVGARYTPDFYVMRHGGYVEIHEVKGGFIRDAGMVRFKAAQMEYPELDFQMWQKKRKQWNRIK